MGTLRKLGKKVSLEKKSKDQLVKLIYSKQKGKKITGCKVSGTKKGAVRKTATKAYESKPQNYRRLFIIDYNKKVLPGDYSDSKALKSVTKIHIFDTYWAEDLYIKPSSNILPTVSELMNKIFKDDYKINIKAWSINWYESHKKNVGRYYFLTNDLKKLP